MNDSMGATSRFPDPLYAKTLDELTQTHADYAFQEQLKTTANVCIDALTYYSDSIVDPITAAADALNALNWSYHNSDLDAFKQWIGPANDTDSDTIRNGDIVHNYCSEGVSDWVYRQHCHLCPECSEYLPENRDS